MILISHQQKLDTNSILIWLAHLDDESEHLTAWRKNIIDKSMELYKLYSSSSVPQIGADSEE